MKFSDAELAEIRRLFRERVQSVQPEQRTRLPRQRSQRLLTLAMRAKVAPPDDAILRPRELAALLGVSARTLGRLASDGHLPYLRTLGGQRRFRWAEVRTRIANVSMPSR